MTDACKDLLGKYTFFVNEMPAVLEDIQMHYELHHKHDETLAHFCRRAEMSKTVYPGRKRPVLNFL